MPQYFKEGKVNVFLIFTEYFSRCSIFIYNLKTKDMKNRIINIGLLAMLLTTLTGCELIGDIFQAGMAVGIFVVILVVVLIIWLINKFRS